MDSSKRNRKLEIVDLSASGICFASEHDFSIGSKLTVGLIIYNALTQFTMNFDVLVMRKEIENGKNVYAVQFINIDKHKMVQLDEIINAENRITGNNAGVSRYNEGMVTNGTGLIHH